MKINRFIFFLFAAVIFSGVIASLFILRGEMSAAAGQIDQSPVPNAEGYASASISKGTILLLLAVGVIGALGVGRKKNGNGNHLNRSAADRGLQSNGANEDRQKIITRNS
jgi:hypothetical protein